MNSNKDRANIETSKGMESAHFKRDDGDTSKIDNSLGNLHIYYKYQSLILIMTCLATFVVEQTRFGPISSAHFITFPNNYWNVASNAYSAIYP